MFRTIFLGVLSPAPQGEEEARGVLRALSEVAWYLMHAKDIDACTPSPAAPV